MENCSHLWLGRRGAPLGRTGEALDALHRALNASAHQAALKLAELRLLTVMTRVLWSYMAAPQYQADYAEAYLGRGKVEARLGLSRSTRSFRRASRSIPIFRKPVCGWQSGLWQWVCARGSGNLPRVLEIAPDLAEAAYGRGSSLGAGRIEARNLWARTESPRDMRPLLRAAFLAIFQLTGI